MEVVGPKPSSVYRELAVSQVFLWGHLFYDVQLMTSVNNTFLSFLSRTKKKLMKISVQNVLPLLFWMFARSLKNYNDILTVKYLSLYL